MSPNCFKTILKEKLQQPLWGVERVLKAGAAVFFGGWCMVFYTKESSASITPLFLNFQTLKEQYFCFVKRPQRSHLLVGSSDQEPFANTELQTFRDFAGINPPDPTGPRICSIRDLICPSWVRRCDLNDTALFYYDHCVFPLKEQFWTVLSWSYLCLSVHVKKSKNQRLKKNAVCLKSTAPSERCALCISRSFVVK